MTDLSGDKSGLKTLVQELHDPNVPPPGAEEAEQTELLPLARLAREKNVVTSRGAGRPPGSRNKTTAQWREYLNARGTSPLVALQEAFNMGVDDLAKLLSCTKLEAYKLQLQCAKELAPYLHQKMPLAIETGDQGLIQLTINMGNSAGGAQPMDAKTVEGTAIQVLNNADDENEQNQVFTQDEIENSNDFNSNETIQGIENDGEYHD
jgi:hypothetical protein